jgi:DNA (cytosine-5)-methyltransferase 1
MQLTHGSLFSGIGGIDLGFERAGISTSWQVEIDPFCRKVLEKRFPHVTCRLSDVREAGKDNLEKVDIISGGFPCQDISIAGKEEGIKEGTRSGLWLEFARIIGELRPKGVFIENVAAIRNNGADQVFSDLARLGYRRQCVVVSAESLGAPHERQRAFIIALRKHHNSVGNGSDGIRVSSHRSGNVAERKDSQKHAEKRNHEPEGRGSAFSANQISTLQENGKIWHNWKLQLGTGNVCEGPLTYARSCRANDGIPDGMDRLKSLGNAVVPQIAFLIAHWMKGSGKL